MHTQMASNGTGAFPTGDEFIHRWQVMVPGPFPLEMNAYTDGHEYLLGG